MRVAPRLFAPLAALNTVVVLLWHRHPRASTSSILVEAGQMAAFGIVISYAYVLVVYVIDSWRAERQTAHDRLLHNKPLLLTNAGDFGSGRSAAAFY